MHGPQCNQDHTVEEKKTPFLWDECTSLIDDEHVEQKAAGERSPAKIMRSSLKLN